jgi:hypothetical protein
MNPGCRIQGELRYRRHTEQHFGSILSIERVFFLYDQPARLVDPESLEIGLEEALQRNVGGFSEGQRAHLAFHRESVFLQSRLRR